MSLLFVVFAGIDAVLFWFFVFDADDDGCGVDVGVEDTDDIVSK